MKYNSFLKKINKIVKNLAFLSIELFLSIALSFLFLDTLLLFREIVTGILLILNLLFIGLLFILKPKEYNKKDDFMKRNNSLYFSFVIFHVTVSFLFLTLLSFTFSLAASEPKYNLLYSLSIPLLIEYYIYISSFNYLKKELKVGEYLEREKYPLIYQVVDKVSELLSIKQEICLIINEKKIDASYSFYKNVILLNLSAPLISILNDDEFQAYIYNNLIVFKDKDLLLVKSRNTKLLNYFSIKSRIRVLIERIFRFSVSNLENYQLEIDNKSFIYCVNATKYKYGEACRSLFYKYSNLKLFLERIDTHYLDYSLEENKEILTNLIKEYKDDYAPNYDFYLDEMKKEIYDEENISFVYNHFFDFKGLEIYFRETSFNEEINSIIKLSNSLFERDYKNNRNVYYVTPLHATLLIKEKKINIYENLETARIYAYCYSVLKDFDTAISIYKNILKYNPDHIKTLVDFAYLILKLYHDETGITCLKRIIEIDPDYKKLLAREIRGYVYKYGFDLSLLDDL
jgi:hypothetical protein